VPRTRPQPETCAQSNLLNVAAVIWSERPSEKDAAYMARQLVQATLPHKNPGPIPLWKRTNGNLTLAIQPGIDVQSGQSYGYPYGTVPRLLLFWMTTEAVKTKSRRLELGHTLGEFMTELGLNPDNGSMGAKRSDAHRLRNQMERLFRARISFQLEQTAEQRSGYAWLDMQVAPEGELWWDYRQLNQSTLWGSWIELGEKFYSAIVAAPVPVDMRALKALKRSPLALDLYAWLTYEAYRANRNNKRRFVSWEKLHEQFGAEYSRMTDFQQKTRAALAKIRAVYPGLVLGKTRGGIEVLPNSLCAIDPTAPLNHGSSSSP
jgi:replication initiator protein